MEVEVKLTGDELDIVVASLEMTILSYEKYIQTQGEQGLDIQTKEAICKMRKLFEKLKDEFY